MARPPSRTPVAGGFPIAMGAMLGTVGGLATGQPTIGFLTGLAIGAFLALLIFLRDR